MEIRKGPYGHFVFERIDSDTPIYSYAIEMINNNIPGVFLPIYTYDVSGTKEISYDFSGFESILNFNGTNITSRRKAISSLFLSIHNSLDLLLPLSNICLDKKYIFTSKDETQIFLCYKPIIKSTNMSLNALDSNTVERLLKLPFFNSALKSDEISQLVYAIKNSDETLYKNTCNSIANPLVKKQNKGLSTYILCIPLLLISIVSAIKLGLIPAIVLFIITILFLVSSILRNRTIPNKHPTIDNTVQETRKQILFNKEKSENASDFNCLIIRSLERVNGEFINNAIYTGKATIGSDFFLSDIMINDNSVAPLNAEINLTNNVFLIKNIANSGNILLEGVKLQNDKEYELKNGQILTIGRINLEIKIGFE